MFGYDAFAFFVPYSTCPFVFFFFFSSRRRHTRCSRDWSSDVCSSDLEVTPPGEVAQHHLAAGERLRDLDEADADQEEAVGRLALPANHLPRLVADQLHAVAEGVEEVVGETREHGHAAEMRDEGAFPVSPG